MVVGEGRCCRGIAKWSLERVGAAGFEWGEKAAIKMAEQLLAA